MRILYSSVSKKIPNLCHFSTSVLELVGDRAVILTVVPSLNGGAMTRIVQEKYEEVLLACYGLGIEMRRQYCYMCIFAMASDVQLETP
jgi:hypothetical protein